jgi:hypothetical protein
MRAGKLRHSRSAALSGDPHQGYLLGSPERVLVRISSEIRTRLAGIGQPRSSGASNLSKATALDSCLSMARFRAFEARCSAGSRIAPDKLSARSRAAVHVTIRQCWRPRGRGNGHHRREARRRTFGLMLAALHPGIRAAAQDRESSSSGKLAGKLARRDCILHELYLGRPVPIRARLGARGWGKTGACAPARPRCHGTRARGLRGARRGGAAPPDAGHVIRGRCVVLVEGHR